MCFDVCLPPQMTPSPKAATTPSTKSSRANARDHTVGFVRELQPRRRKLRSYEKHVPEEVFKQPDHGVAVFHRHLWATDRAIFEPAAMHTGARVAFYSSNSEQLARDVQHLLLRLGICATLRCVPQKQGYRPVWNVVVSGLPILAAFIRRIGAVSERKRRTVAAMRRALDGVQTEVDPRTNGPRDWSWSVLPEPPPVRQPPADWLKAAGPFVAPVVRPSRAGRSVAVGAAVATLWLEGSKRSPGTFDDLAGLPVSTEKCRWMAIEFCRSTWESDGGLIRG